MRNASLVCSNNSRWKLSIAYSYWRGRDSRNSHALLPSLDFRPVRFKLLQKFTACYRLYSILNNSLTGSLTHWLVFSCDRGWAGQVQSYIQTSPDSSASETAGFFLRSCQNIAEELHGGDRTCSIMHPVVIGSRTCRWFFPLYCWPCSRFSSWIWWWMQPIVGDRIMTVQLISYSRKILSHSVQELSTDLGRIWWSLWTLIPSVPLPNYAKK